MIDSTAIANLQMLMNTGDGRQAVLSEVLHTSGQAIRAGRINRKHASRKPGASPPEINGRQGRRIRLLQHTLQTKAEQSTLPEKILGLLDEIPTAEKKPLIAFAEGLAYQYNNLFMGLIGHISIVMFHLDATHPSYPRLRDCEELLLNTAMLTRLMVDVLRRSDNPAETIYPIDLSDREIGSRIWATKPMWPRELSTSDNELRVHQILQIIAAGMAEKIEKVLHSVSDQAQKAFPRDTLRRQFDNAYRQVRLNVLRGLRIAESTNEYAGRFEVEDQRFDLLQMLNRLVANYKDGFGDAQIRMETNSPRYELRGDPKRLGKAFLELIANASEMVPEGDIVHLSIRRMDFLECPEGLYPIRHRSEKWLKIAVQNTPPSYIDSNLAARIFEPFTSLENKQKQHEIGLAASLGIIRRHGGTILVDFVPARNISLNVFLPIK